jgi:tRNA (guanine-N7-)-methyltransferase
VDDLLPRYGLPFTAGVVDWARVFGRAAPVVLEIGFGMGETTAAIAAAHPDVDFVGVEVHLPGVGALLARIESQKLSNVRVIRHDAADVVSAMIAPVSLAAVHVFFPDPWPKKRHHKRRLLNAPFVHALAHRLAPGGYLHVATDWAPYADHVLATLSAEALLANTTDGYTARPPWRPETKFERRGLKLGHAVFDLVFNRC